MKRLPLLALAALAAACAPPTTDLRVLSSPSDRIIWDAAQRALEKRAWESARQYLRRIVDTFPQSRHHADARILLADTYFQQGGIANYILAASSYREFLTFYPRHPRSDYAQFRVAECHFKQRNSPDRDQTATLQALDEYRRLLDVYPDSEHVDAARQRIQECRQALARSNYLVGFFYQRGRKAWRAAIGRYEIVLTEYPDYEKTDEVLFRISQCLAEAGREAEALPHIGRLEKEFPESRFLDDARELRARLEAEAAGESHASEDVASPSTGEGTTPAGPTSSFTLKVGQKSC